MAVAAAGGPTGNEPWSNEVRLVGRLAAAPQERVLPSGDAVATFRLVVPRALADGRPRRPGVDAVDCAVWTAGLRRRVLAMTAGSVLEVSGAVRRRFWRGPAGATSRVEVEVQRVRRVRRAGPR